jgi:hypothetical protein
VSAAPPMILDAMLRRLDHPTVRRLYPDVAPRAEAEGMSYRGFLEILVSEEPRESGPIRGISLAPRRVRAPALPAHPGGQARVSLP